MPLRCALLALTLDVTLDLTLNVTLHLHVDLDRVLHVELTLDLTLQGLASGASDQDMLKAGGDFKAICRMGGVHD